MPSEAGATDSPVPSDPGPHLQGRLFSTHHALAKTLLYLVLPWTLLVMGVLALEVSSATREHFEIALNRARDSFKKDVSYRLWATERGGVYVPLDEKTPANPYLAHLPNREITTTEGKVYTLVNPAYMTRMVHELSSREFGLKGHITSLKPLRPENAPDPWESKALEAFERGPREIWEKIDRPEGNQLRYMGAFVTVQGCLRCHAHQGYKVGDIRGGISVTVRIEDQGLLAGLNHRRETLLGILGVWVIGLGVIALWYRHSQNHARERRAVLAELQESHARYRSLVEAMPLRLYQTDREGRITFANQALQTELGKPLEACLGLSTRDIHPPEMADRYQADDARVLQGESLHQVEDHFLPGDPDPRKVEVIKVPLRSPEGEVVGIQGVYWDVTDRVELEQRLRAGAERFEAIQSTTPDGLWSVDMEGRILSVNKAYCEMSGYSPEELVGSQVSKVEVAENEGEILAHAQEIQRTGRGRFRTQHRRKDGSLLDVEVTATAIHATGQNLAFVRDLTRENEAQRRIVSSESRYRSIFNDAAIPIWEEDFSAVKLRLDELRAQGVTDLEAFFAEHPEELKACANLIRILDVNEASVSFFGARNRGELSLRLGTYFTEAAWRVFARELSALASGANRWESEIETSDAQGNPRVLSLQLSVAPENRERLDRVLVSWIDLTPLKQAEAQRRRAEEELRHAHNMESLGSLAGGIAHDMNNVLAAILGLTSTLQVKCAEDAPVAKALGIILHAANRGRDLVKGLTDFARKGLKESQPLDLNALVRREAELLQRTTLQKVEVQLDLQEDLPQVVGESNSLASALMNLCINALDAMPKGGRLRISTRLQGGRVLLQVKDSGEGMSPEVLSRALEPFFTTKPVGKGTGLGLSIVYGTVKAHGGSVDIQSQLGEGTTVTLGFPALTETTPEEAPDPVQAALPNRALRILLVDDDDLIRASVPTLLESLGHQPEVASGGLEALRRLEAGLTPDLVILDLSMPGMGGPQVLERIRLIHPKLPVLIATGFKTPEVDELMAAHPDIGLLMKPYALEELRTKLGQLARS